jgi:transposase
MIQITPRMRILVTVEAVDFRRGIDGLAKVCRETLGADPFFGALFGFRSRSAASIRVLAYEGRD